jgi:hypothetical protein
VVATLDRLADAAAGLPAGSPGVILVGPALAEAMAAAGAAASGPHHGTPVHPPGYAHALALP